MPHRSGYGENGAHRLPRQSGIAPSLEAGRRNPFTGLLDAGLAGLFASGPRECDKPPPPPAAAIPSPESLSIHWPNCCPRTIAASPLLIEPSAFTSARKFRLPVSWPERLRVMAASAELTLPSPFTSPTSTLRTPATMLLVCPWVSRTLLRVRSNGLRVADTGQVQHIFLRAPGTLHRDRASGSSRRRLFAGQPGDCLRLKKWCC